MRVIAAEEITKNVREMCIEANVNLSEDMEKAIRDSVESLSLIHISEPTRPY